MNKISIQKLEKRIKEFGRESTCPLCNQEFRTCSHSTEQAKGFLSALLIKQKIEVYSKCDYKQLKEKFL